MPKKIYADAPEWPVDSDGNRHVECTTNRQHAADTEYVRADIADAEIAGLREAMSKAAADLSPNDVADLPRAVLMAISHMRELGRELAEAEARLAEGSTAYSIEDGESICRLLDVAMNGPEAAEAPLLIDLYDELMQAIADRGKLAEATFALEEVVRLASKEPPPDVVADASSRLGLVGMTAYTTVAHIQAPTESAARAAAEKGEQA
ncbi:MAG: hypothetical protein AAGH88_05485 [Planctomycetota bacterium]